MERLGLSLLLAFLYGLTLAGAYCVAFELVQRNEAREVEANYRDSMQRFADVWNAQP